MANVAVWFELPARDVHRAARFYTEVLGVKVEEFPGAEGSLFFDHEGEGVTGEITQGEPGTTGVLLYLAAPRGVEDALSRVEAAGGKVLTGKTSIGDHGWIGIIQDTEGNRVGVHNMQG